MQRRKKSLIEKSASFHNSFAGNPVNFGGAAILMHRAMGITDSFSNQLDGYLKMFHNARIMDQNKLDLSQPSITSRSRGVARAWQAEKADILMGGKGTANWSKTERQSIVEKVNIDGTTTHSGVQGVEGHHIKNVADHPELQAEMNNIKFYRSRPEHLNKGHHGDWKDKSDGKMIDRDTMLKRTNLRRILKNEISALGLTLGISAGVGFLMGFISTLAINGLSRESVKNALRNGIRSGGYSTAFSLLGYVVGRVTSRLATNMVVNILEKIGIVVLPKLKNCLHVGISGVIISLVSLPIQYFLFKKQGLSSWQAQGMIMHLALKTGIGLLLTTIAYRLFGWKGALIVGVLSIGYELISSIVSGSNEKQWMEKTDRLFVTLNFPEFAVPVEGTVA